MKIIVLFCAAVLFASCGTSDMPGYKMNENGLYYKFYSQNEKGKKLKREDFAVVKLLNKIIFNGKDSIIYDSKKNGREDGTIMYQIMDPKFKGSLEEGLMLMAEGDSASFTVSADSIQKYFPAKDSSKLYAKGTKLYFEIKLMKIRGKEEVMKEQERQYEEYMKSQQEYFQKLKADEPKTFENYLKTNNITQKPTPSGLYYIEIKKGTGANPKSGDNVEVNYTGKFLDGNIFDSSEGKGPFIFPVGQQRVIPGWDEAIPMMKKGGKATLIIPSHLAYDSTGVQDPRSGQYGIPPYSPLVFDVELLDIKPTQK